MTVLWARRSRLLSAIIGFATAVVAPAVAQQPNNAIDLWSPPTAWPLAESGKPVIFTPPPTLSPSAAGNCLPGMPCGLRLLGSVQRNGAVELQVPAWRW